MNKLVGFVLCVVLGSSNSSGGLAAEEAETNPSQGSAQENLAQITEITPSCPLTPFERQALELWSRDIEAYRQYTKDPEALRPQAEAFIRGVHWGFLPRPRGKGAIALLEEGQKLIEQGSQDFLIKCYYAKAMADARGLRYAAEIADKISNQLSSGEDLGYPREALWLGAYMVLRCARQQFISVRQRNNPQSADFICDAGEIVAERLADPSIAREMRRVLFWEFNWMWPSETKQYVGDMVIASCRMRSDRIDPWVNHLIFALWHVEKAWRHRGTLWAPYVTEEGWKGFHEELEKAKARLSEALKLHPEYPEAATLMIPVAMAGATEEPVEEWFEKAVAAEFDYMEAYRRYLWALRPRWGGSLEEILELGKRCASTRRYDTFVPLVLIDAVEAIDSEMPESNHAIWKMPGVYETVRQTLEEMADHPCHQGDIIVYPSRAWLKTRIVYSAMRAERLEEARNLIEQAGNDFRPNLFAYWVPRPEYTLCELFALTGKEGSKVAAARKIINQFEPPYPDSAIDEALKLYEEAKAADDSDRTQTYCDIKIRELKAMRAYNAGDWYEVPVDKQLLGWIPQWGKWEYRDENSLIGRPGGYHSMCLIYPAIAPPPPYEVEFEIESPVVLGEFRKLGLWMAPPDELMGAGAENDAFYIEPFGRDAVVSMVKRRTAVPLICGECNKLKIQVADGHVVFWVNDQKMIEHIYPDFHPYREIFFGLCPHFSESDPRAYVILKNVRFRKWNPEKPQ